MLHSWDAGQPTQTGSGTMQRARGAVQVCFGKRTDHGPLMLETLYQSGSAKCMLPRGAGPGLAPEVVLLNTAGGVTGGDEFQIDVSVSGGAVAVTSQTAERIYRSSTGAGRIRNHLEIGPGGRLDWLPQETILFDGGRLSRRLTVDMAQDATLWAVESLVLGRQAMGETVAAGCISDQWRVRRGGRLVYADGLRLGGDSAAFGVRSAMAPGIDQVVQQSATANGWCAIATVLHVAAHAEDLLEKARTLIAHWVNDHRGHIRLAASAWNGLLSLRCVARTGRALRAAVAHLLTELRGTPMPHVWSL